MAHRVLFLIPPKLTLWEGRGGKHQAYVGKESSREKLSLLGNVLMG